MTAIQEIFNNREIAIGIWVIRRFAIFSILAPLCINDLQDQFVDGIRIVALADQFVALFVEQLDQDAAFHIVQFDFHFFHI